MSIAGRTGNEILVNTTTVSNQNNPAVTALSNGGFVVTWVDGSQSGGDTSGTAIRAQVYTADGSPSGNEFLVNATTSQPQTQPTVTGLAGGRFVVAWSDSSVSTGDGSGEAVRAQIFNADGSQSAAEFVVPVTLAAAQTEPSIAALPNGGFVAVWSDFSGVGDIHPSSVRAQMFDAAGNRVGAEFRVNTTLPNPQWQPAVAVFPDGHFVVAWTDLSGTGGDSSPAIRAQVFNADGTLRGGEFRVNTTAAGVQQAPSIAVSADGHFAIAWTDTSQGPSDIRAQVFNADGSRAGVEFVVNTTTSLLQSDPTLTALPDGRFVAAWTDGSASAGDVAGAAIRGQVFTADGTLSGSEFLVNTTAASAQSRPTVTTLADGRFVVAWEDMSQTGGDTAGSAIRAQAFMMGEPPVITSNGGGDSAAISLNENQWTPFAVTATDEDSPTLTYSIAGGADASLFQIDAASGLMSFVAPPNFEAPGDADDNNTYEVVVRVSDGTFNDTQAITFTVQDVNELPSLPFSDLQTFAAENSTSVITTVQGSDPEGAPLTYSISGGADAAHFAIDASTGALSFVAPPDFESPDDANDNNMYAVTVRVSDGSLFNEANINVVVVDANEAPTIAGPDLFIVPENGATVATISATDPEGAAITYSIVPAVDSDLFQINPVSGALSFIAPPDFEAPTDLDGDNLYHVRVRASDSSLFVESGIVVSVTNVNESVAPAIGSNGGGATATVSVVENTRTVTTVAAADPNNDALTYAIVGGADAARFTINASTGALSFVAKPDFEAPADADHNNSYLVTVRATDAGGLFDEQAITVNVTNLTGVSLVGDGNDNLLVGTLENDTIYGRGANDRLVGSGGGDVLNGEGGTDTADYLADDGPVTVDLVTGTANDGQADTLVSIENVIGSASFNDTIRGDDRANKLEGAGGDDLVEGRGGNDCLEGDGGTDILVGGAGDDELYGQTGVDTADYRGNLGGTGVAVDLRTGVASGGAGNDRLISIENLWGSNFNDTLHGNDEQNQLQGWAGNDTLSGHGGNDSLDGGDGNDTVTGGAGVDSLFGGAGNDTFVWNTGDGGDDVVGGSGSDTIDYNGSGAAEGCEIAATVGAVKMSSSSGGPDVSLYLTGVEALDIDTGGGDDSIYIFQLAGAGVASVTVALGTGNDVLTAGDLDTRATVSGQDGDDFLSAGGGNDKLNGDAGDDYLSGGAGIDTLDGGAGNDTLVGGLGADALIGGAGTDTAAYVNDSAITLDLVAGTASNGSVDTLSGIENVIATAFGDTLRGNDAANALDGRGGDDLIEGRGGNDQLMGEFGNDRLNGGDGNDSLNGDAGNDVVDGQTGDDTVRGGDGNDTLEGRDGNDQLYGDAGADTIDAGAGNDLIFGGDGNDRLFAAGGIDTLTGGAGNDLFYYTNGAPGQMNGDTITDFQSVAGQNTGDSLVIRAGYSGIVFGNGSTAITYNGVTETLYHPGVTLSLANDILVV